jgi:hypothetical protein
MSRLDLKSLGITSVSKSIETLTFFFYPGEGKRSSKGVVSYKRKKEGKIDAPEQYLQISRSVSEVDSKQVLSIYLNETLAASFEFTANSATLTAEDIWDKTKQWIVIPTDPTFDYMVKDSLSAVVDGWLESERFEEYLERQAENLTFNTGFTKAILLFMSYLANRDEKKPNGDVQVTTGNVDLATVAKTYTHLLTRLHNTSPRTKKLFPIQQLIEPAKEIIFSEVDTEKTPTTVEVIPELPAEVEPVILEKPTSEIKEPTQETEYQTIADTSLVDGSVSETTLEPEAEKPSKRRNN